MRIRALRYFVLIFVVVLGTIQTTLSATKKAEPPTAKDLVGVWIGFDSDQLTFTRLDLRADSTGFCARVSPADTILHDQGVHVYRIESWSLYGWNIDIKMTPISNAYRVGYVRGRVGLASMKLTIGGPENSGWKEEPFLSPESRIMISDEETRKSIEKREDK
jgi:hypothetical protein